MKKHWARETKMEVLRTLDSGEKQCGIGVAFSRIKKNYCHQQLQLQTLLQLELPVLAIIR